MTKKKLDNLVKGLVNFTAKEKRPWGFWKDRLQTLFEVRDVMTRHDLESLPSQGELGRLGYADLANAISKHHGGFRKFRTLLGENQKLREKGVLKDPNFLRSEVKKMMEKRGYENVPSVRTMQKNGDYHLVNAILRHYGGVKKLREDMGGTPTKREAGVWKDREYTLIEVERVMLRHGLKELPSARALRKLGYAGLAHAIGKYHGFRNIREFLGEPQKKMGEGAWMDLDFTIDVAYRVMEEQGYEMLPTNRELRTLGEFGLAHAIGKYHGGFPAFRQLLKERDKEKVDSVDALVKDLVEGN